MTSPNTHVKQKHTLPTVHVLLATSNTSTRTKVPRAVNPVVELATFELISPPKAKHLPRLKTAAPPPLLGTGIGGGAPGDCTVFSKHYSANLLVRPALQLLIFFI